MKVTKAQKEGAAKIFGSNPSFTEVFVNKNSEYFTNENLASLSVQGKKSQYARINSSDVENPNDDQEEFKHDTTVEVVEGQMNLVVDGGKTLVFPAIKNEVRDPQEGDVAQVDGKPADGKFTYDGTTMVFDKGELKTITFKQGGLRSFFKNLGK